MNLKKLAVLSALALALVFGTMMFGGGTTKAAGPTCSVPGDYATIQGAVNDINCTTINVAAGAYPENISIGRTLTLNGAQAGNSVAGRTFPSAGESTLTGQITVQASGVTINGFSLTNPALANAAFGIVVKTAGDGAVITNNIIDSVSSTLTTSSGTAQGVYLENGPDNVQILFNRISNIQSDRSSKGILIGDSVASNPSLNVFISGNTIEDITSTTRGAYGIQVNNGASTAPAATGYTEIKIQFNTIDDLTGGGWAHAIGLEGDTPQAGVEANSISDVIDLTPSPVNDAIAVWFEENPSFGLAEVHHNSFTGVAFGIVVHPNLSAAFPSAIVDGECNWWGAANGPGPIGPGSGAGVSPNVDYTPWQTSIGGACVGPDADGDGVTDAADNCPNTSNSNQADADGDGLGNACDTCPLDSANDSDGDGICGNVDNCPTTANTNQADADHDGIGDVCDADDDNDGVLDAQDQCPNTPLGTPVSVTGCPKAVNANQCKNDGWKTLQRANATTFKNQGDCIQYVNTGK